MKVVILADKNARASIAVIRSLSAAKVPFRIALSLGTDRDFRLSFVRYLSGDLYQHELLVYDDSDSVKFIDSLLEFQEKIGPYILFPSGEQVLRWAIAKKDELYAQNIILPTVDLNIYQAVSDKFQFVKLVKRFGLDTPKEYAEIPKVFTERFVVKPVRGVWGDTSVLQRPVLVESPESLVALHNWKLDRNSHFIQEYIEGPSLYYCALYNQGDKQLCFTQQTVVQQPGGMSVVKAVPAELPKSVIVNIDAMMAYLEWHGIMMIEVKRVKGKYYAIECNPRLWGPLQLAVDNGVDFPYALWKLSINQAVPPARPPSQPVGYLWFIGFLHGYLLKWQTRSAFQIYSYPNKDITFRDVWLRRDSFRFVFVEFLTIFMRALRMLLGGVSNRA